MRPGYAPISFADRGRVLPRHEVPTWECEDDLDHRPFAQLFMRVWASLPLYVRRRILRFWKERVSTEDRFVERRLWPTIRLVRTMRVCDWRGEELLTPFDAIGAVNLDGSLVRFSLEWLGLLPEDAAQALVAHELAHVYLRAIGADYSGCPFPEDGEHEDVEMFMDAWGFDDEAIERASVCVLDADAVPEPGFRQEPGSP